MYGVKSVDNKKFCGKCEIEVIEGHNYCHNCGNPLNLESVTNTMQENLQIIDEYIEEVALYSKENDTTLKDALKKVREDYE
ncbi:TPA: hypothetical protein GXZ34_01875 [bacterium]|jgi:hypothetical protein|nr:hypothetical protein [bacterium]